MRGLPLAPLTTLLLPIALACTAETPPSTAAVVPAHGGFDLLFGPTRARVEPRLGARVTQLQYRGRELLSQASQVAAAGDDAGKNQFGSTFWVSPQAPWGWPPEAAIDSAPYRVSESNRSLVLHSPVSDVTGLQVTKRFTPSATHLEVQYRLHNPSAQATSAAPWEITRVVQGGLVVFPASAPELVHSTLHSQLLQDVAWVDLSEPASDSGKLFQDGSEGWLAYVHRGLALLKTFSNIPANRAAEGEAEVEIYVNGSLGYLELEQQGPVETLAAGASATAWAVQWRVRPVPAHIPPVVGDPQLVEWLRQQARH